MGALEGRMSGFGKRIIDKLADVYWTSLSKQLNKYGLRYEDVLVETPEVMEAVRRLPAAEKEARSMRLRRAVDLTFKKTYLPEGMQAANEPFKVYLNDHVKQVEAEVWEQKQFDREHRPL